MTVPLEAEGLDYFFRPNFALLNAFFSGCNEGVPVPARENLRLVALPGEDQFMEKDTFVCRVCLVRDPSSIMRSLADKQTRELLIKCTSITVSDQMTYYSVILIVLFLLFRIRLPLETNTHNRCVLSAGLSAKVAVLFKNWLGTVIGN